MMRHRARARHGDSEIGEGGREGGRPLSRCFREKNEKPTLDRGRGRAAADGPRRRWRRGEWNKLSFRRDRRRVYTSSPILILSILPRSLDRTSIQSAADLLASPPSPLLSLHSIPTPPPLSVAHHQSAVTLTHPTNVSVAAAKEPRPSTSDDRGLAVRSPPSVAVAVGSGVRFRL